jgi:hypothetical protein
MRTPSARLDYFETVQVLNGFARSHVIVYSVAEHSGGAEPQPDDFVSGLAAWGRFKPVDNQAAAARRALSDFYAEKLPELALGDAPLELYHRQVAHYTFEDMDDLHDRFAGFALWQHGFIEARWLDLGGRFHWLWIRAGPLGFVVAEEFEPPPRAGWAPAS